MLPNDPENHPAGEPGSPVAPLIDHPKGVGKRWIALLMLCSAVIGGLLMAYLLREPNQKSSQPRSTTPEKVISDQTLELRDGSGEQIASIVAGGGESSVLQIGGTWVYAWADGHATLKLIKSTEGASASNADPFWNDLYVIDVRTFSFPMVTAFRRGHDTRFLSKDFISIWARLYDVIDTRRKSIAEVLSTVELSLIDRNGWQFATLGLTASGDPAIAFTDKKDDVCVAWVQRRGLTPTEPDWWDIAIYEILEMV